MEFLVENPSGCTQFMQNKFKEENCTNCGKDWTFHKGIIADSLLASLGEKRRLKEEAKKATEELAKKKENTFENRRAAEKEKQRQELAESWYANSDGMLETSSANNLCPPVITLDDDDDDKFEMVVITPSQQVPIDHRAKNSRTVIKNLLPEFDEMNVADPITPAEFESAAVETDHLFGDHADAPENLAPSFRTSGDGRDELDPFVPTMMNFRVIQEELRQARRDAEATQFALEDKTIEFDILKDELEELKAKPIAEVDPRTSLQESNENEKKLAEDLRLARQATEDVEQKLNEELRLARLATEDVEQKLREELRLARQEAEDIEHKLSEELRLARQATDDVEQKLNEELRFARQATEELEQNLNEQLRLPRQATEDVEQKLNEELRLARQATEDVEQKLNEELRLARQETEDLKQKLNEELRLARQATEEVEHKLGEELRLGKQLADAKTQDVNLLQAEKQALTTELQQQSTTSSLLVEEHAKELAKLQTTLTTIEVSSRESKIQEQVAIEAQDKVFAGLRADLEALATENTALKSQVTAQQDKEAEFRSKLQAVSNENVALKLKKSPPSVQELKAEHATVISKLHTNIASLKASNLTLMDNQDHRELSEEITKLKKKNEDLTKAYRSLEARRAQDIQDAQKHGAMVAADAFREIRQNAESQFAWLFSKVKKAQDVPTRTSGPQSKRHMHEINNDINW